jgi:hypothetical protein
MRAAFETRRRFLGRLLTWTGGASAVALTAGGCAPPGSAPEVGANGATEIVAQARGLRYANVRPDHVAAVRLLPSTVVAPDWSTSKRDE